MATTTELQDLILVELNATDDKELSVALPTWWSLYSDKATTHLQYLYSKRHALGYLMGKSRKKIDVTIGTDKLSASQEFKHLKEMHESITNEIKDLEPGGTIPSMSVVDPTVLVE